MARRGIPGLAGGQHGVCLSTRHPWSARVPAHAGGTEIIDAPPLPGTLWSLKVIGNVSEICKERGTGDQLCLDARASRGDPAGLGLMHPCAQTRGPSSGWGGDKHSSLP